jgi:hypothetical protein
MVTMSRSIKEVQEEIRVYSEQVQSRSNAHDSLRTSMTKMTFREENLKSNLDDPEKEIKQLRQRIIDLKVNDNIKSRVKLNRLTLKWLFSIVRF